MTYGYRTNFWLFRDGSISELASFCTPEDEWLHFPTLEEAEAYRDENLFRSCPSHCCIDHGCKYGYAECPVKTGRVEQEYPCEFCEDDAKEALRTIEWLQRKYPLLRVPALDGVREEILKDFPYLA